LTISIDINNDGGLAGNNDAVVTTFNVTATSTVADLVSFYNSVNTVGGTQAFDASFADGNLNVSLTNPNALDTDGDGTSDSEIDITFVDAAAGDLVVNATGVNGAAIAVGSTTLGADGTALTNFTDDLTIIDAAITSVADARSQVGAFTSAFQFQNANINTQIENLTAAKSTIVDVDIAEAQTNFTNAQVLTEAATAALAQANQITTSLLSLLR